MALRITVEPVSEPLRSPFITLRGERDPSVTIVEVDGVEEGTVFPTATSWLRDVHLDAGAQVFEVCGVSAGGDRTETLSISISYAPVSTRIDTVFNRLDDMALEVGLERLPGEKNLYLRNRVLDAWTTLGNATYEGLMRALARELSLDTIENAFVISLVDDSDTGVLRAQDVYVTVEPTRVLFESEVFQRSSERIRIDPGSGEAELEKLPLSKESLELRTRSGRALELSEFELVEGSRIRVFAPESELFASYRYHAIVEIEETTTLTELASAIEALERISEDSIFSVEVDSEVEDSLARLLVRPTRERIPRDGLPLSLSEIQITPLSDKAFQESLENEYGTYLNTKLEAFAKRARAKGRSFLEDTILDRDVLLTPDPKKEASALTSRTDPVLAFYRSSDPTDSARYSEDMYVRGDGASPVDITLPLLREGLLGKDIQSGPADDLSMVGVR